MTTRSVPEFEKWVSGFYEKLPTTIRREMLPATHTFCDLVQQEIGRMIDIPDKMTPEFEAWLDDYVNVFAKRYIGSSQGQIEKIIRELVRRLKKVGWNWSDKGAEKMGRVVMMRRYDKKAWEEFWQKRMNLQGRCHIRLVSHEATVIT